MADDDKPVFLPEFSYAGVPLVALVVSTGGSEIVPLPTMERLDVEDQLHIVEHVVKALRRHADELEARAGLVASIEEVGRG